MNVKKEPLNGFFSNFAAMFKQLAHKTFAVVMALLVMVSTLSVTIEKHFCGDFLVDVSVFSKVDSCCSDPSKMDMEKVTKKMCCKNTLELIEGQDELKTISFDDLDNQEQVLVASFFYSYASLFEVLPKHTVPYQYYAPPDLVYDVQLMEQVFII